MYLKLHFKIILKYVPFVVLRAARAQRADAAPMAWGRGNRLG